MCVCECFSFRQHNKYERLTETQPDVNHGNFHPISKLLQPDSGQKTFQTLPVSDLASYLQDWSCPQYGPLHPAGIALLAEGSQTVDQEVGTLGLA